MNRNNFRQQQPKRSARYRVWIKYKMKFVSELLPQSKVYYSYEKENDPLFGYNKLLTMVRKRLDKIEIAILYNNQTNQELQRF